MFFVILLASMAIEDYSYEGYLEVYLIPNMYYIKPIYYPLSFSLSIASMVLFSDAFLELKTRLPKFQGMNIVLVTGWGALMLLTPFTSYHILAKLILPWAILSLISVVLAGIVS